LAESNIGTFDHIANMNKRGFWLIAIDPDITDGNYV
jgi:hypothetical protein